MPAKRVYGILGIHQKNIAYFECGAGRFKARSSNHHMQAGVGHYGVFSGKR